MKTMMTRLLAAVVAFACLAGGAAAQGYPNRTIKLVVAYAPGGLPDTVARIVAQRLQESFGQSVVVDNRPGGSGGLAAALINSSPADGYTFFVTDGPLLYITPFVTRKMTYDPAHDFVPVSLVGVAPLFLAVNADVKANTLDELIALAKAHPGTLNYGSAGTGTIHHLTTQSMTAALGLDITHVPFKGSGASVPAMIGKQVDMVFASPPALMGFVTSGQAKLLAVNSIKRSPLAPNVPALSEKIPGFDFAFNVAVLARTGTPKEVIDRVSDEIAKIVRKPEVIEQLQKAGVEPVGGSAADLDKALKAEGARVSEAARRADLKPD
ncbi:tripartite tricarboxylate transporter substrate binding protein [soil metagenome]